MMTRKLYEENAYQREFEAEVVKCIKKDGRYQIILDKTIFFPEGGGQSADKGILSSQPVLDVQEDGKYIYHTVENPIAEGISVKGEICWDTRYRTMQNHSGEHIVTGIIHRRYGYNNVGFHMGSEMVTLDLDGIITPEQLNEIEEEANQYISDNLSIKASYPTKEEEKVINYRSKMDIDSNLRIIEIDGVDICACCGTHTRTTGEIHVIKLLGMQAYKGGVRISMLAGRDAIEDYNRKHIQMVGISQLLSAKMTDVEAGVRKLAKDSEQLKLELAQLKRELMEEKVKHIGHQMPFLFVLEKFQGNELRNYVNLLIEKIPIVMAVAPGKDNTYSYIIGSLERDCSKIGRSINEKFSGKGGGNAQMVQGSIQGDEKEIKSYFESLL
jgi:alanyl-tRNA synthetase